MSILSFPCELLVQIFKQLDVQSAFACQRVNRLFHKVFQDSTELQYSLECQIAGVDDNPYCSLPVSTRLQMLRDRESAWSSFIPRFTISERVLQESFVMFDVSCGLLVNGLVGRPGDIEVVGGGIKTHPIPTRQDDSLQDESSWSVFKVNGMLDCVSCLYEHDLLVFLVIEDVSPEVFELRLSLISHSLNSPHPLAQESIIPVCQTYTPPTSEAICMNVAGKNLVLCIENEHRNATLYIFNWQTGKLKAPPLPDVENADLTFLRHDLLLRPSLNDRCFNVHYIPPTSEGGDVKLIQRLSFPTQLSYGFTTIRAQGSLNVTDNDCFPKFLPSERPFLERPQDSIIAFDFAPIPDIPGVTMIVHRKSLIDLLPPQSEWSQMDTPLTLVWEQWGPEITHWIKIPQPSRSLPTPPYGQRYIGPRPTFAVLDFNPYHCRNANYEDDVRRSIPIDDLIPSHLPFSFQALYPYDHRITAAFVSATGTTSLHWDDDSSMVLYRASHFG